MTPEGKALAVPLLLPLHVTEVELTLIINAVGSLIEVDAIAVHPLLSVTVTE